MSEDKNNEHLLVKVSKAEAGVLAIMRQHDYAKFVITKRKGDITRIEPQLSYLIKDLDKGSDLEVMPVIIDGERIDVLKHSLGDNGDTEKDLL